MREVIHSRTSLEIRIVSQRIRGARMASFQSGARHSDHPMTLRETAPKLSTEQYEKNFAELVPPMTSRQAAIEAARCLYCFDAPCTMACPTHIDVPAFIKKISTGNFRGSARVILDANILGQSCGRVCPTEVLCEGACVMDEKGIKPIEIGRLQRYAVDYVLDRNIQLFRQARPTGSAWRASARGPRRWRAAAELAKWGTASRFSTAMNRPAV